VRDAGYDRRVRRRRVLVVLAALIVAVPAAFFARPVLHLAKTAWSDAGRRAPTRARHADDASRLELTEVAETWDAPDDPVAAESRLAELLARARRDRLSVSIAGARHSMGGHTISPGGIVVNMRPMSRMRYDADRDVLVVGAGALWSEVIAFLNKLGRSVAVVQSFSSFTVGGSISVNAHGWQFREPPLGSTVLAMRVMLADGRVVRASRDENRELFSLVVGGYGLFGIILDAELRTVPNDRCRVERAVVKTADLEATWDRLAAPADVAMAYARLDVSPDATFSEAILNVFHRLDPEPGVVPTLESPALAGLRRAVFRGSVGSDYGKRLRWRAEKELEEHLAGATLYRNQILDDDVSLYEDRSAESTEILEEYFLPHGQAASFLDDARRVLGDARADVLNVTIRRVREDHDALLRYADRDMTALVFLFHRERTAEADAASAPATRALVDAALARGGRYYLPYRLHATKEQFAAAYPQATRFFELKRRYDPDELFRNRFYDAYGR